MDEANQITISQWKNPKFVLKVLGMVLLAGIIIVSIIRDRIVNVPEYQVTVAGQGKVSYKPDIATVTLGVQIDKASTAEGALQQLNEKMNKIIAAVKAVGINDENIITESYLLSPQYDFRDGVSFVSGYNANQKLSIKITKIDENEEMISRVISEAGKAGTNQMLGIKFDVSNLSDLKQEARIKAIKDAKNKLASMAEVAGVKLGKVAGWYENIIQSPDVQSPTYGYGAGGVGGAKEPISAAPQIPQGIQEIIIELNLSYEIK